MNKTTYNQLESILSDEQMVETTINAAAGVIIRSDNNNTMEVLLIQRSSEDHWKLIWEFPRGKCDKPIGENLIHCLKREVKEETGLDVKPIEKIDIHEYLADGGKRKTTCHNYLCMMEKFDQKIKLSHEHDSFKWITEMGQMELMLMPEQIKTLKKVFNTERSISLQPTDGRNEKIDEHINRIQESSIGLMGAYISTMIAKTAYDFYKKNFSKFARECSNLPEKEKTICMLNAKARAKKIETDKLKSSISKCSQAKNPEKCRVVLTNKFNQANATYKLSLKRLNKLQQG